MPLADKVLEDDVEFPGSLFLPGGRKGDPGNEVSQDGAIKTRIL